MRVAGGRCPVERADPVGRRPCAEAGLGVVGEQAHAAGPRVDSHCEVTHHRGTCVDGAGRQCDNASSLGACARSGCRYVRRAGRNPCRDGDAGERGRRCVGDFHHESDVLSRDGCGGRGGGCKRQVAARRRDGEVLDAVGPVVGVVLDRSDAETASGERFPDHAFVGGAVLQFIRQEDGVACVDESRRARLQFQCIDDESECDVVAAAAVCEVGVEAVPVDQRPGHVPQHRGEHRPDPMGDRSGHDR